VRLPPAAAILALSDDSTVSTEEELNLINVAGTPAIGTKRGQREHSRLYTLAGRRKHLPPDSENTKQVARFDAGLTGIYEINLLLNGNGQTPTSLYQSIPFLIQRLRFS
jgi:hypothetical protein